MMVLKDPRSIWLEHVGALHYAEMENYSCRIIKVGGKQPPQGKMILYSWVGPE